MSGGHAGGEDVSRADTRILRNIDLAVGRPMVLLRLGYSRPAQVSERVSRLIDEVMEEGRGLLAPAAVDGLFEVETGDGRTVIGGALRSTSRSLHERLAGCRQAVLFAATVGQGIEDWLRAMLAADNLSRALLADAFASSAAIALGLEMERRAELFLKEHGLAPTRRYAPGYGDWELSAQAPLHALLGSERVGISLSEDFLMTPSKSVSGVIGGR